MNIIFDLANFQSVKEGNADFLYFLDGALDNLEAKYPSHLVDADVPPAPQLKFILFDFEIADLLIFHAPNYPLERQQDISPNFDIPALEYLVGFVFYKREVFYRYVKISLFDFCSFTLSRSKVRHFLFLAVLGYPNWVALFYYLLAVFFFIQFILYELLDTKICDLGLDICEK